MIESQQSNKCVESCAENTGVFNNGDIKMCVVCGSLEPKQYLYNGVCHESCIIDGKQLYKLSDGINSRCVESCTEQEEFTQISNDGMSCVLPNNDGADSGDDVTPSANKSNAAAIACGVIFGLLGLAIIIFAILYVLHRYDKFNSPVLDRMDQKLRSCTRRKKAHSQLDGRNYKDTDYYSKQLQKAGPGQI